MNFLNKPNDNFFYFFGIYSVLFVFFDFINSLAFFEVLTYLWFLGFFIHRLYDYYAFVKEHKPRIKKLTVWETQKELSRLVTESEENIREGVIIILITFCIFIAFFLIWRESPEEVSNTPVSAWANYTIPESIKTQKIPTQIIEEIEEEIIEELQEDWTDELGESNDDWVEKNTENLNEGSDNNENILLETTDELSVEAENKVVEKKIIQEPTWNLIKEENVSLRTGASFNFQVKDVYSLQPFTKNGSSFSNILQLQRVLSKLWYYKWVSDGVFNFETKLAIYDTLVKECRWPAATTTWVFWSQAKACIDNLFIVVQDFETEWLPE